MSGLSRRRLLLAGGAYTAGAVALCSPLVRRAAAAEPADVAPPPFPVHPRADWGADLPPTGALAVERPEDVRFLLVHHSASANGYGPEAVSEQIRSFFRLHTGPDKGWPDVAYNFFVDRFGAVWEGRQGSLVAPVKGDATGGSQGFALLCCFIGDHRSEPPTPEAQAAMVELLAWLAERHGIDSRPEATARFVSRGSNRWPAGAEVVTATIAGHRDMSRTVCPGDAAYRLVREEFPARVSALLARPADPSPPGTATTTATTSTSATTIEASTTTIEASTTTSTTTATTRPALAARPPRGDDGPSDWLLPAGGAAALVGAAALLIRRRSSRPARRGTRGSPGADPGTPPSRPP